MRLLPSRFFIFLLAFSANVGAWGQAGAFWQQRFLQQGIEHTLSADGKRDHLSVRPFALRDVAEAIKPSGDTALVLNSYVRKFWESPEARKWKFDFTPLLMASLATEVDEKPVYTSAPGLAMKLDYGKKWSFYGDVLYGGTRLPSYANAVLDSTGVIPSFGKNLANMGDVAFALGSARLDYAPSEFFQFELGYGKNFFGQGYRSLFLSDVAFTYPYLKVTSDFWNFKYVNLYSALKGTDFRNGNRTSFQDKYSTTHYLSWAVSPMFNVGLFETIVWQGNDTLNNRGFDPNYLNPIIFYRPVEYSVGSPDNALLGIDLSFKATSQLVFYGQLLFDEFLLSEFRNRTGWWGNKWGAQLGFKTYDIGFEGLRLQGEFNVARPFTYTHGSVLQNFGHYNQPLAHQLGTNFYEGLLIAYYEKDFWYGEAFLMYATFGRDPDSLNFGGDIYKSYVNPALQFGNEIGQGVGHTLYFQRLTAGVILNRSLNLRAGLSYTFRREDAENLPAQNMHLIGVHFATQICNSYREF